MSFFPKEIPFSGDERPKAKVIELSSTNDTYTVLTNGIESRALSRDRLTWGGDFAGYVKFQQEHDGQWPTPTEQNEIRDNARRDAFTMATPLPEPDPDHKSNFS